MIFSGGFLPLGTYVKVERSNSSDMLKLVNSEAGSNNSSLVPLSASTAGEMRWKNAASFYM